MTEGETIGPYEVLGQIGHGTMGRVLRCRQAKLNRMVALKVLDPALAHDKDGVKRFLNEARAASSLRHPNIAAVIDVGTCPQTGAQFIAFELIEGSSLEDRLRKSNLAEVDALRIACGIADALTCTEAHGVVHRDLRPVNILVTPDGTPKLIDLGLAKRLDQSGSITAGAVVSSPHYVAPEQAMALPDLDTRADLYALGITLYRCVTGILPFDGNDFLLVVTRHVNEDVPDPRRANPKVSAGCAAVIAGLCMRKREQRYSARAAHHDLRRLLAGEEPLGPAGAAEAVASGQKPPAPRAAGQAAARPASPPPRTPSPRTPPPVEVEPSDADASDSKTAAPPTGLPFRVTVTSPTGEKREVVFDKAIVTVGRDPKCDLQINDKTVSRRHCELLRNGLTYALAARETANGTFVNERPVTDMQLLTPVDDVRIAEGFRLKITPVPRDAVDPPTRGDLRRGQHEDRHARPEPADDLYATKPPVEDAPPIDLGDDDPYAAPRTDPRRGPGSDAKRTIGERKGEPGTDPKRIGARIDARPGSSDARPGGPGDRADPPSDRDRRPVSERAPAESDRRNDPGSDRARVPSLIPEKRESPSDRARHERREPTTDRNRTPRPIERAAAAEALDKGLPTPVAGRARPVEHPVAQASSSSPGHVVVVRDGREERLDLGASFKLGRGHECDLRLSHPHAPRKAALIVRGPDGHRLFNVAPSIDTVKVNGAPIADEALLAHGDELSVYGTTLRFEA